MKKEKWISIYKAILIILMVIGHTTTIFGGYIYTFHIAAFFLISGYLFKDDSKNSFVPYFEKKFKSLIIPFIINTFILTLIAMVMSNVSNIFYSNRIDSNIVYLFLRYLNTVDLAGALWFLPVLFFTEVSYKLLIDILKTKKHKIKNVNVIAMVICFFIAIWGYTYYQAKEILPYYLDIVMLSILLFSCGNNFKKIENRIPNILNHIFFIISIFVIYVYKNKYWQFVNWPTRTFPNILTLLLISFAGAYIVYYISKLLSKIPTKIQILSYIGDHTLPILSYHFLGFRLLFGILYVLNIVDVNQTLSVVPLYSNTIYGICTALFGIAFSLLLEYAYKKLLKLNLKKIFKNENIVYISLIIIITFIFNIWIFDSRNFFVFDDFSHLKLVSQKNITEIFQIIPNAVYNSRPIGQLIIKLFVHLFNYNFVYHACSLLIIHIANCIMLYFLSIKMFKFNKLQSFIISLIFGVYPTSIMAFTWEAAIFDLLGCTITLICLLLFYNSLKTNNKILKIIYNILLIIMYYLGLRTKEMLIALPCVMFIYLIWKNIYTEKCNIKDFIKKNKTILILLLIMILYFAYSRILNANSNITNTIDSPYYYSFSIISIVTNLFRYIYLYFDLKYTALTFSNVDVFKYSITSLFFILIVIYSIYLLVHKKPRLIFIGVCFIAMILPVLPMSNMQHILYLYIPSMFIAMIIIDVLENLGFKISPKKAAVIICILFICNQSTGIINFRNWWFEMTSQDKKTYNYLVSEKNEFINKNTVNIINVDTSKYYSYFYGPGAIINVALNKFDIVTHINPEKYNNDSVIIDCAEECKITNID